jgi:APA family basic amino acid/polyamine antiporter
MMAGVGLVTVLYVLTNVGYLSVLPHDAIANAPQDRVGTAALQAMFGDAGLYAMAGAIMISTFGANNGLILAGARVYYAMARDGLFFRAGGELHARYRTPHWALVAQAVWTSVLCLSGTYTQLLDYVVFAAVLFYGLTVAGLFSLRIRRPDLARPVRALGFPWIPAFYVMTTAAVCINLLIRRPQYAGLGLAIVALGVPVYFLWRRFGTVSNATTA